MSNNKVNFSANNPNEKLLEKAARIMIDYNKATGSSICIYDSSYKPHFPERCGEDRCPEKKICPYCKKYSINGTTMEQYPCHEMHVNAVKETGKKGGCHVYKCSLGLLFWASPIYTDGTFSGAIRGAGFSAETQKGVDIFANSDDTFVMCNNEIPKEEFKERVNSFPGEDDEKVQSLAEMMQLCAESLSSGSEDYHETVKRRAQQQETISKIIDELKRQHPTNAEKLGYPLEKEKTLMSALRKGEGTEAKKSVKRASGNAVFYKSGSI